MSLPYSEAYGAIHCAVPWSTHRGRVSASDWLMRNGTCIVSSMCILLVKRPEDAALVLVDHPGHNLPFWVRMRRSGRLGAP